MATMFLFLLAFLPCVFTLNCSSSIAFDGSSCTFSFDNIKNTCGSFNFLGCTWEECGTWRFNGKFSYCAAYVKKNDTSWNKCTSVCCDDSVSYLPSWDSVSSCQGAIDARNSEKKTILIIILSVIGGVVALLVVTIVTVCCCRRCNCKQNSQAHQMGPHVASHAQWGKDTGRSQKQPSNMDDVIKLNWIDAPEQLQKLKDVCSVCLEHGTSLQLQCGHCYHRKCIVQWVSRKQQCVFCRSTNINNIKVYCQSCYRHYAQTTLTEHLQQLSSKSMRCWRCEQQNVADEK